MKEELLRTTENPEGTEETKASEETEETKPESEEDETFDFNPTSSGFYRVVTVVTAVGGFIAGIVLGNFQKAYEIGYKYHYGLKEEYLKETFNTPLMFYVWIGTLIVCLAWGAVSTHFNHQETIIALLRKMYIAMPDRPADSGT